MSQLSNIINDKNDFSQSINKFTLTFINQENEEEFLKYKFERKNILLYIAISIYFSMIILGNAFINRSLIRIGMDILKKVPTDTMDTISPVLWYSALILEFIIFFIKKLTIIRGFLFNSLPLIAIIYRSYINATAANLDIPMLIPITVIYSVIVIIASFIYAANWICGALQIIIYYVIFEIYLIIYPWNWFTQKPVLVVVCFLIPITVILSLNYFEYFQRKAIFMKIEAEKQKKYLTEIINKIPDPIIINQNEEVIYQNKAFTKIDMNENSNSNSIDESSNEDLSEKSNENIVEQESDNSLSQINEKLEKIEDKLNGTTLKDVIKNGILIESKFFIVKKLEEITHHFEISSVDLSSNNYKITMYLLKNLTNGYKIKDLKEKEKFLRVYFASLSHDFRTPLGIIMGTAEILISQFDDLEIKQNLTNIYNAASIILLLVQDILDYSQLKSGTLSISPVEFDIKTEFEMIINLFKEKYSSKNLYLEIDFNESIPKKSYNDPNRIKQILMNLLSNAYKFTLHGGVKVNISYGNNRFEITVTDTGVGMEEKDKQNLFKEFGRLDRHKDINPMGIGLGLHICKQLISKMGGNITVESQPNVGTCFTFNFLQKLVIKSEHEEIKNNNEIEIEMDESDNMNKESSRVQFSADFINPFPTSSPIKQLNNFKNCKFCSCSKLLIVDDDPNIRKIIKHYAQRHKIQYDESENGMKAFEKVKAKLSNNCCQFYKLILTDYSMPEMDGINASILIKKELQQFANCDTKIILVSGLTIEESTKIQELEENPFFQIEPKPLLYNKFKQIVLNLIQ